MAWFFFYLLLVRLTRNAAFRLSPAQLALVFSLKTIMGCVYGWLFLTWYGGDDTWVIHDDTLAEWAQMKINPLRVFTYDIRLDQYIQDWGWKEGLSYFRMKLEKALINKPLGVFNFYSQGNYYINVVAFSFMSFWGGFWLYQVLAHLVPKYKSWTFLVIFLYPPALFWLSGIRSDAVLFFFFSLLIARLSVIFSGKGRPVHWFISILAWLGIIVVKASFAFLLLLPITCWWLVSQKGASLYKAFFGVHLIAMFLFFLSGLLPGALNLPRAVLSVQQDFFALEGNTRVALPALTTSPVSYMRNLPAALDNIFLRPYPWEAKGILQYGMVAQNIFIICLLLALVLKRFPGRVELVPHSMIWALAFFSFTFYLSIGYTIPFPGAVIRYRVIPETLLVWLLSIGALGKEVIYYNFFNVYKNRINS
ncbi:hypothetical protein [Flavihumibacter sp. CACIAM 22H1]|uniref:hypothetical protein n=1 Tax=Flavihumibacter sp. CACIAM 22H1 TaxID=1812911 RepID=UPI0007A809C5|nr:hypothetical protein [Flavihumibacter sp. CACIAM 22H1]KYP16054.1 MAG: hypothetical protein A1D16_18465 [Flavihumibacter sp. CACIAM 22H1]